MTALLVVLGAMVGAPLRYVIDRAVQARHDSVFPWGTFVVNVTGSFVLGFLAASATATPGPVMALLGVGFCGALTTYSTFGYETLRLVQSGATFYAILNALGSIPFGLAAAYLGLSVAQAFN
ncbi:MAG TPA: fluoride efflux transporter CrcB [Micromonosporaceae bacterium]|nr:fluoride efflux transporter CrcB [Micromonosporaceae bacterium]HCU52431.1 fluoride efflux transporter CrcB [Micromonosporaceae bacterium]